MVSETGYSGTPLPKKLGYRAGDRALLVALPEDLPVLTGFEGFAERASLPALAQLEAAPAGPFDLIHAFERDQGVLAAALGPLRQRMAPAGRLWVSWPKKASRQPTTLDENRIRALALATGLVDVKVCAIDAVWSGLMLVIPRHARG